MWSSSDYEYSLVAGSDPDARTMDYDPDSYFYLLEDRMYVCACVFVLTSRLWEAVLRFLEVKMNDRCCFGLIWCCVCVCVRKRDNWVLPGLFCACFDFSPQVREFVRWVQCFKSFSLVLQLCFACFMENHVFWMNWLLSDPQTVLWNWLYCRYQLDRDVWQAFYCIYESIYVSYFFSVGFTHIALQVMFIIELWLCVLESHSQRWAFLRWFIAIL